MTTILLVIVSVLCGSLGTTFIKMGSAAMPTFSFTLESLRGAITNPTLILGIVLMVVSFPVYAATLQRLPLSVGYPLVTCLTLLTITLLSVWWLHESLTLTDILGIVLLIAGIVLISK